MADPTGWAVDAALSSIGAGESCSTMRFVNYPSTTETLAERVHKYCSILKRTCFIHSSLGADARLHSKHD